MDKIIFKNVKLEHKIEHFRISISARKHAGGGREPTMQFVVA